MKKQKNISWMYIRYSMLSSVSIALICTIVYVWKSEQQVYDLLWKESITSVPIGLFIMTTRAIRAKIPAAINARNCFILCLPPFDLILLS